MMHQNKHTIDRRTWLKLAGAAGAQLALAGCSALSPWRSGEQYVRPLSSQPFHRPNIDASQIVKTLVGLRPYRASGFVVRGERMDEKIVIHNYGHGGGGITLSWGSSSLAVAEAPDIADKRAAVIGCGVMGLSTARQLQQRGWRVTIYAKDLPPNTTSNIAGGECVASSVFSRLEASAAFDAQFREAMRLSHEWFAKLVGVAGYGVYQRENYYLEQSPRAFEDFGHLRSFPGLFPAAAVLSPNDHPFAAPYALRHIVMLIEPPIYLSRLLRDFQETGGEVITRQFAYRAELLSLSEPVIINCSGLGARELFNDAELTPVRGQLVVLPPDARVDYMTHGLGDGLLYMFPRSDGLILGGAFERGATDLAPDADTTARIVGEHAKFFRQMRV